MESVGLDEVAPGAAKLLHTVQARWQADPSAPLGVNHWLLALVQRHAGLAESLTAGLDSSALRIHLQNQLQQREGGDPLDAGTVVHRAVERAHGRGRQKAAERDLAAVILAAGGYQVVDATLPPEESRPVTADPGVVKTAGNPPPTFTFRPRARRPTATLEQFGRDLTRAALDHKLSPVVGRDAELELVIETLCRRTKRNPVLVGFAGVGKTAIVEGLAQLVVRGAVPAALQNVRIFELQPSTLVAGAGVVGELSARVKAILTEASQDGIVLFIDEVHSIVGAGGAPGSGDVASLLKPALARGDLACIAATTDGEYHRFIEPDAALERRFQPIRVQEITVEQTMEVLRSVADDLERGSGVHVADEVSRWLVDFADQYLRNRTFPDKAIDLLEQCVAHAVTHGKSALDLTDAAVVAQRMVGMPLELDERLATLQDDLARNGLLATDDARLLLDRLSVTMRGLDLHAMRPNAVVLLLAETARRGRDLGATIAGALFGSRERVVTIDFGRMTQEFDVTMLLGAPPGYVGYSDTLPLHRVAQIPWCVLLCDHLHSTHPQILEVLAQSLHDGFLTDAQGKRVYLSDTVVILTAATEGPERRSIGFHHADGDATHDHEDRYALAGRVLPANLVDQVDLICVAGAAGTTGPQEHLAASVLDDLANQCRKHGVTVTWDDSVVGWLGTQVPKDATRRQWERVVEQTLSAKLAPYMATVRAHPASTLVVAVREGALDIQTQDSERE